MRTTRKAPDKHELMDNFSFDVTARSRATFELAMRIATADFREAAERAGMRGIGFEKRPDATMSRSVKEAP